jgi:hypothetical protein
MKNSRFIFSVLFFVIVIQSIFIFSSFNIKENKKDTFQSYKIERKFFDGQYFYVLVNAGQATAFIKK